MPAEERGFDCWQCEEISKKEFSTITTDLLEHNILLRISSPYFKPLITSTRNSHNREGSPLGLFHRRHLLNISEGCEVSQRKKLKIILSVVISPGTRWTEAGENAGFLLSTPSGSML